MLRKTLATLSLVGLLLSAGLWGVSYLNIVYYSSSGLALTQGCVRRGANARRILVFTLRQTIGGVISTGESSYDETLLLIWLGPPPDDMSAPDITVRKGQWVCCGYSHLGTRWLPTLRFLASGYVEIPLWMPTAFFALLFWFYYFPIFRRRKRKKLGLCVKCGYDLRGSEERCPECNTPFENDD